MFKRFSRLETNLRRAGYVLFAEIVLGILLSAWLHYVALPLETMIPFIWIVNLPAVWFLTQAAKRQGHSAWLTALTSLPPLVALINFLVLLAAARRRADAA